MTKYVIQRLLLALVSLFLILSLTFILMKTLPLQIPEGSSPEAKLAFFMGEVNKGYLVSSTDPNGYVDTLGKALSSVTINSGAGSTTYYFWQKTIMEQYASWLTGIFTKWDWGTSTIVEFNKPCMQIILNGLPSTISVNAVSVVIAVPLGIGLGILAALKKGKPTDTAISTIIMILISVPSFVLVTFLIMILGYNLHWLPTEWPKSYYPGSTRALGFIIPVIALSLGSICGYCRFTRAELCDVLSSDYLLLARTKGLTRRQAVMRHALRNAMVPILPSILSEIVGILGGSMIVESLYNIPGIGRIFITALNGKDYNLLMVDMAFFTMIGLVAGIVLDLSYGFLDPRIRMGAKK